MVDIYGGTPDRRVNVHGGACIQPNHGRDQHPALQDKILPEL
jgi:hypothetical protein